MRTLPYFNTTLVTETPTRNPYCAFNTYYIKATQHHEMNHMTKATSHHIRPTHTRQKKRNVTCITLTLANTNCLASLFYQKLEYVLQFRSNK